jgi:hypothetical protein
MRAAGTAGNAKRGVKNMIGTPRARPSPEGAGTSGLGEKFHMLEAHLRKSIHTDDVDASLDFGEKSVDSARVEYLFLADAPASGMPHTSASSSASVIVRTEQAARPPPVSSLSPISNRSHRDHSLLGPESMHSPMKGDASRRHSSMSSSRQPPPHTLAEDDGVSSGNVLLMHEEERSALALGGADSEPWPLVEAAGLVGLQKGPLEPLLAAHMAAGLEHTLRKDPYFVDGPYRYASRRVFVLSLDR